MRVRVFRGFRGYSEQHSRPTGTWPYFTTMRAKTTRITRRGRALSLGICIAVAACSSGSATLELRLAHSGSPESLIGLSADEFARRANERLGDRATVVVFGSSLLGGDEVVLQKLKLGTVDMSVTSTVLSSIVDALALFEMP